MLNVLRFLSTTAGREPGVLDELRAELETWHGTLFDDTVWASMPLAEKEAWFTEVLDLLRADPDGITSN